MIGDDRPRLVSSNEGTGTSRLWLDQVTIGAARSRELLGLAADGAALHGLAGFVLAVAFWTSPHRGWAAAIALAAATVVAGLVLAHRAGIGDALAAGGTKIGVVAAKFTAGALGLTWSLAPLILFPGADDSQRLIIVAVVVAALADCQRLGAPRAFALFYVLPLCAGAFVGFAMGGTMTGLMLALGVPFYGWFVVVHGTHVDAEARRRIAAGLVANAQHETIHELLLDFDIETSDWLWRSDAEGRLVQVSDGAGEAAAARLAAAKDAPLATLFAPEGRRPSDGARAVLAVMAAEKPFRNRLVEIGYEAGSHWWRLSGEALHDAEGRFLGYRGIGSDVSGARNSESRIAYLANHDALTGFANRTSFQVFAKRQCAAATDADCRALLCLDLDGFKNVNDSLGHQAGDELLKLVAARLTAAVPAGTLGARIGGDEFAFVLQTTTPAKAEATARSLVDVLRAPFDVDGLKVDVGGSVGIALAPKHGTDAETLLVKADLALYRAKTDGKAQARVFEESFETSISERRKLEADLKLALARGEFVLHYQPLADMLDGRVVCFEALIRWLSPERGFVPPSDFIPAAESAGLIAALGRYILFEACRTAAAWPHDIQLAVNISPPHVRSPDFLQDVTMALKWSGMHPSRLQIEVTEGVFLDKSDAASAALQTLRTRGVKIALDDFGTGYSSLNYLVDFPVDKIKIDRAFVRDLVASERHQAIVDAMIGLARKLSIRVTAEGVETKDQALSLKRRRCDEIQGFLLSKPRPASAVPEMIAEVPALFREAIPTYTDSALAMVLAARKPDAGQAA